MYQLETVIYGTVSTPFDLICAFNTLVSELRRTRALIPEPGGADSIRRKFLTG